MFCKSFRSFMSKQICRLFFLRTIVSNNRHVGKVHFSLWRTLVSFDTLSETVGLRIPYFGKSFWTIILVVVLFPFYPNKSTPFVLFGGLSKIIRCNWRGKREAKFMMTWVERVLPCFYNPTSNKIWN